MSFWEAREEIFYLYPNKIIFIDNLTILYTTHMWGSSYPAHPLSEASEASFHQHQSPPSVILPPSPSHPPLISFTGCSLTKSFPLLICSMLIVSLIHYTSCKQSEIHQAPRLPCYGTLSVTPWRSHMLLCLHTGKILKAWNCNLHISFPSISFSRADCIWWGIIVWLLQ